MILDGFLAFDTAANLAQSAGTYTSTNIIDLHLVGIPVLANNQGARDIGIGDDPALKILVVATTAFSGGTSLQVKLQGATDNGSGSPNAFVDWYVSPVTTDANIGLGARLL